VERYPRWDVTDPGFLVTILRIMSVLGVMIVVAGALFARGMLSGLFSGVVLAMLFYLATLQAGRIFLRSHQFVWVMLWLLGAQILLWVGMFILLAMVRVDAVGFILGVSVFPGAIIVTILYWWLIKHKGMIV